MDRRTEGLSVCVLSVCLSRRIAARQEGVIENKGVRMYSGCVPFRIPGLAAIPSTSNLAADGVLFLLDVTSEGEQKKWAEANPKEWIKWDRFQPGGDKK
ncbi:hypothetical protein An12g08970 [Aspergillus niger]|uniref:Uncharacterized protein n=2 Tax=Aspergillus niger TaxID=5061 RepID=A2R0L0_ASPNC|nr:hypothetical protein An12g08970 [Aspergillus niger]CAK46384.1 hypothetical protein An12g08970 [Aspergillus niger]